MDLDGETMTDGQAATLAAIYRERSFVIVDGVTTSALCALAHAEMAAENDCGRLEPSTVYSNVNSQAVSAFLPDRRSDRIQYVDLASDAAAKAEEALVGGSRRWQAVGEAVEQMDVLVRRLRVHLPAELSDIESRTRPMVSAYEVGAKFERHCDNHCDDEEAEYDHCGEHGHCANRRRLSAVLYAVDHEWSAADGGALRLYKPTATTGGWEGDDALVDVQPRPARLVLFASDQRVPHEVLPVTSGRAVRYALALWFLGPPPAAEAGMPHATPGQKASQQRGAERESATSIMEAELQFD